MFINITLRIKYLVYVYKPIYFMFILLLKNKYKYSN